MKKTKIVCTMGPKTENREVLTNLVKNGMNVARFNFSHGDHEEQLGRVKLLKSVREELGVPVAMLLDTKGPEIRTGLLKEDKITLKDGQTFTLTTDVIDGDSDKVTVTYTGLPNDVVKGNKILIDDGLIELEVVSTTDKDVVCTVLSGGELSQKKGVNVPNVNVKLPALTEKDKSDILFGIEHGYDFIAASFVRTAEAVKEIRAILDAHNSDIKIIAKIENQEGVENIDAIIAEADGIMVARGDLGVEIPAEEVPFVQKRLIKKCNDACKPVITATQMLDSMMRNARPTRAEVTDVANAIYDGTDVIMLSGESANGSYPVNAVRTMAKIAEETEKNLDYHVAVSKAKKHIPAIAGVISRATCNAAAELQASAIISSTQSGATAQRLSQCRPECPIVAVTPCEKVAKKLVFSWGVYPIVAEKMESTDEMMEKAVTIAEEAGFVKKGDTVVMAAGVPVAKGATNLMKVSVVE